MNELSITACSFHTRKKNKKGIEGICSLNSPKLYKDEEHKEEKKFSLLFILVLGSFS